MIAEANILAGVLILMAGLLGILVLAVPGIVARRRHHPSADAIALCGFLGVVTGGITWIVAIIWAYAAPRT